VRAGRSAKRRSAVSPRLPGGRASGSATSTRSSLGTAKGHASDVTAQSRDQKRAANPPETSSPRRAGGPTLRRLDLRCATFRDSGLSNRCPLRNDLRYGRPGRISQVHAGRKQKGSRVRGVDQPAPPGAAGSPSAAVSRAPRVLKPDNPGQEIMTLWRDCSMGEAAVRARGGGRSHPPRSERCVAAGHETRDEERCIGIVTVRMQSRAPCNRRPARFPRWSVGWVVAAHKHTKTILRTRSDKSASAQT
jgi:hypothetical protein